MIRKLSNLVLVSLLVGSFVILSTGCTVPTYGRTVAHHYDANGRLTGTVITESVSQPDTSTKPILDVLEDQDYRK